MRILNRLGGIALSNAYTCIKAISKKKLPMIAKLPRGVHRRRQGAGPRREARPSELFGMIEKFAGYGFNKSHSTAYALIAYMTAYLKAHYPVEFMAALLSCDIPGRNFKSKDALVEHLEDCRRMNIDVRAAGREPVRPRLHGRRRQDPLRPERHQRPAAAARPRRSPPRASQSGPFTQHLRLLRTRRSAARATGRRSKRSIKAGAFDALGGHRAAVHGRARPRAAIRRRRRRRSPLAARRACSTTTTTKPTAAAAPLAARTCPPWTEKEQLAHEKEVLGYYLSSHPLAEFEANAPHVLHAHQPSRSPRSPTATKCCSAACSRRSSSRTPRTPARAASTPSTPCGTSKTSTASPAASCGPSSSPSTARWSQPDAILAVRGKVDRRPGAEEANLIVDELIPLADLAERFSSGIVIRVRRRRSTARAASSSSAKSCAATPAPRKLKLRLDLATGGQVWLDSSWPGVDAQPRAPPARRSAARPGQHRRPSRPPAALGAARQRQRPPAREPARAYHS